MFSFYTLDVRLSEFVFKLIFVSRQNCSSGGDVWTRLSRHDVGHQERLRPQGHHEPRQGAEAALRLHRSVCIKDWTLKVKMIKIKQKVVKKVF